MSRTGWKQRYLDLARAVSDLYYSAHWYPDREVDAEKLWTALRDEADFEPGKTSQILGPPRGPLR
jgi:hypothetical protein